MRKDAGQTLNGLDLCCPHVVMEIALFFVRNVGGQSHCWTFLLMD